jgi:DNA-binding HxlR family transcriptional regulator
MPDDDIFSLLGRKSTVEVILTLRDADEPMAYGDLDDETSDMSSTTLSRRLKELSDTTFVERRIATDEFPAVPRYRLTDEGEQLAELIREIRELD